ncbi:MAG: hypothetical protein R3183_14020, partial [Oleiphilaceae bacterium]|nr:hypothetical protein [Oleiphilaceae bacterium]
MVQTIRDLKLQAGLLVLVVCGLLTSLLSIFTHIYHEPAIPGRFALSVAESIAGILLSLSFYAQMTQKAPLAIVSATLFVVFGSYALTAEVIINSQSIDLINVLRNLTNLPLPPSIAMLIFTGAVLLGFRTNRRRLFALVSGFIGVLFGVGVSLYHMSAQPTASTAHIFGMVSPAGGLFCIAFGVALVILASQTASFRSRLPRDATVIGIVAVTATFFLVYLGAFGEHSARHSSARTILEHHAKAFQDAMESQANLVERMVNRWAALDFNVPERLQQTEARRYINDIPALKALLLIQPNSANRWRVARSSYELLWLMDQVVTPEALRWLRETKKNGTQNS